jgi:hypothetical protein
MPTATIEPGNTAQERHADAGHVCSHNMRHGVLHGAFFHMATAFADPYAVIPLFLAGFTESRALIGLVVSLVAAVGVVPQIAMARQIRRKPSLARPLMLVGIWTRCGVWGLIAIGALLLPVGSAWLFILFTFLVSIYSLGGGVAVLPFKQVISGTIPPERRSTFFGWRLVSRIGRAQFRDYSPFRRSHCHCRGFRPGGRQHERHDCRFRRLHPGAWNPGNPADAFRSGGDAAHAVVLHAAVRRLAG